MNRIGFHEFILINVIRSMQYKYDSKPYQQSVFMTCRFSVCKSAYLNKCIGTQNQYFQHFYNKSFKSTNHSHWGMWRTVKNLSCSAHTFSAVVKQDDALPAFSSSHTIASVLSSVCLVLHFKHFHADLLFKVARNIELRCYYVLLSTGRLRCS